MEGLACLLESPEFTFRGELDDTLINRLCSCILCCDDFHIASSHNEPTYNKTEFLVEYLNSVSGSKAASLETNRIKIILSLLIKRLCLQSNSSLNEAVRRFFRSACSQGDESCTFVALDVIGLFLRTVNTPSSLNLLQSLIDKSTIPMLISGLQKFTNIHYRKLLVLLLAHLNVLENASLSSDLISSLLAIDPAIVVDFLWCLHITAATAKVPIEPVNLSATPNWTARLLYLACLGVVRTPSMDDTEFLQSLGSSVNLLQLAGQVVALHLRTADKLPSCPLLNQLLSYWTEQVIKSLHYSTRLHLYRLTRPIEQVCFQERSYGHKCLTSELFSSVWCELCAIIDRGEIIFTQGHCEYRGHLLKLGLLLFKHCDIVAEIDTEKHLQAVQAHLAVILVQSDHCIIHEELEALLQYISYAVALLLESRSANSLIEQILNDLTRWSLTDVLNSRSIFQIASCIKDFAENILQWRRRNAPQDNDSTVITILQSLLSSTAILISSAYPTIQMEVDNSYLRESIVLSILKLLVPQMNAKAVDCVKFGLVELIKKLFAPEHTTDDLLANAEIRGYLICLFVWSISYAADCMLEHSLIYPRQAWVKLMDFEWSELFESNIVIFEIQRVSHILLSLLVLGSNKKTKGSL